MDQNNKNKKLFPQKLWELIHNPSVQHYLRWSDDGLRVYLNRSEFEAFYLKTQNNQFHTQKAISFVRQMNMYGFRKVDDRYYENDNFRRDQQHLLRNMFRRHPSKGRSSLSSSLNTAPSCLDHSTSQQIQFQHQLQITHTNPTINTTSSSLVQNQVEESHALVASNRDLENVHLQRQQQQLQSYFQQQQLQSHFQQQLQQHQQHQLLQQHQQQQQQLHSTSALMVPPSQAPTLTPAVPPEALFRILGDFLILRARGLLRECALKWTTLTHQPN